MPLPNASTLNDRRQVLLQQIESHRERLLREIQEHKDEVMRQINAETTIVGHIPSNILSHIFTLTLTPMLSFSDLIDDQASSNLSYKHQRSDDWVLLSISQVCRSWREIALGTSGLWAEVNLSSDFHQSWNRLKDLRSRISPLRLKLLPPVIPSHMPGLRYQFKNALKILHNSANVGNIHALEIDLRLPSVINTVVAAIPDLHLIVETLMQHRDIHKITVVLPLLFRGPNDEPPLTLAVPENRVQGIPLQKVMMQHCRADLSLPYFKHVTHLLVSNPEPFYNRALHDHQSQRMQANSFASLEAWLHMLRNMPQLIRLHIRSAVKHSDNASTGSSSQPTTMHKVVLPHLVELSLIAGIGRGIGKLLWFICPQQPCKLYISDTTPIFGGAGLDEINDLAEGLKEWFSLFPKPLPDPGPISLMSDGGRFMITNFSKTNPTARFSFQIVYLEPTERGCQMLTDITSPFLTLTTSLKIISRSSWIIQTLNTAFKNVRKVILMEAPVYKHHDSQKFRRLRKQLPFVYVSKYMSQGRLNLDFPPMVSLPALDEIQYLPRTQYWSDSESSGPLDSIKWLPRMAEFIHLHLQPQIE